MKSTQIYESSGKPDILFAHSDLREESAPCGSRVIYIYELGVHENWRTGFKPPAALLFNSVSGYLSCIEDLPVTYWTKADDLRMKMSEDRFHFNRIGRCGINKEIVFYKRHPFSSLSK